MKGVQCYELFGGIALKNHTFSFFISLYNAVYSACLLMLFAAITNAVCLNNAISSSFFIDLCKCFLFSCFVFVYFIFLICIMHSAFNLFVFPNYMFTSLLFFVFFNRYFL